MGEIMGYYVESLVGGKYKPYVMHQPEGLFKWFKAPVVISLGEYTSEKEAEEAIRIHKDTKLHNRVQSVMYYTKFGKREYPF